jgi:hypothetical protein
MTRDELIEGLLAEGFEVSWNPVNGVLDLSFRKGEIEWMVFPDPLDPWTIKYDWSDMNEDGPHWTEWNFGRATLENLKAELEL